ncbi:hypothetical protein D7X87_06050 [bacterium D16-54]|nr:hypothetical protein D7X87_06050 [bacterium D16-54]RKJ15639.1 hypothetical protein D7X65_06045 [bacterium D16-56]
MLNQRYCKRREFLNGQNKPGNSVSFNWKKWQEPARYLTRIYISTVPTTINSRTHWGMNWTDNTDYDKKISSSFYRKTA